jgi:FKBP-type peptidyl-prolyl cis-trans isomerase
VESAFSALHYTAFLEDGTMIDNSYSRGQPLYFVLGKYSFAIKTPGSNTGLNIVVQEVAR